MYAFRFIHIVSLHNMFMYLVIFDLYVPVCTRAPIACFCLFKVFFETKKWRSSIGLSIDPFIQLFYSIYICSLFIYIYIYIYEYMFVYKYIYRHIYTYTKQIYIHIYIYIYISLSFYTFRFFLFISISFFIFLQSSMFTTFSQYTYICH